MRAIDANVADLFDGGDPRGVAPSNARTACEDQLAMRMVALLVVVVLLAACAHDQRVRFPAPATVPTGTLVVLFGQPASDVAISINGVLVVSDVRTRRVVVENVPVGTADVIVAANGIDKAFHQWIASDHATTVPLGVPDASTGFIKTLAGTLLTILVYSLLHH